MPFISKNIPNAIYIVKNINCLTQKCLMPVYLFYKYGILHCAGLKNAAKVNIFALN